MDISLKTIGIAAGIVLLSFIAIAGVMTIKKNAYDARIVELQNAVATRDQTIEVQKGVFQKLSIQSRDLQDLLDQNDAQLKLLQEQLKKSGDQLLTAATLIVKLKKDLESKGTGTTVIIDSNGKAMALVKFDTQDDLSPFRVTGETVASCDITSNKFDYNLKLYQIKPLKLSVVVSQGKDGAWKTSTTSSEENFQVDIGLAAVNPYILEPRWYENIGLSVDLGGGTGFIAGVGASYKIGKFEVGPKGWFTVGGGPVGGFVGAQLLWHPFAR